MLTVVAEESGPVGEVVVGVVGDVGEEEPQPPTANIKATDTVAVRMVIGSPVTA